MHSIHHTDTALRDTLGSDLRQGVPVTDLAAACTFGEAFADDVLNGLAAIGEEEFVRDSLHLALSMSLWISASSHPLWRRGPICRMVSRSGSTASGRPPAVWPRASRLVPGERRRK